MVSGRWTLGLSYVSYDESREDEQSVKDEIEDSLQQSSENLTKLTSVTTDAENVALLTECSKYTGGTCFFFLLSGLLSRKPNFFFSS